MNFVIDVGERENRCAELLNNAFPNMLTCSEGYSKSGPVSVGTFHPVLLVTTVSLVLSVPLSCRCAVESIT